MFASAPSSRVNTDQSRWGCPRCSAVTGTGDCDGEPATAVAVPRAAAPATEATPAATATHVPRVGQHQPRNGDAQPKPATAGGTGHGSANSQRPGTGNDVIGKAGGPLGLAQCAGTRVIFADSVGSKRELIPGETCWPDYVYRFRGVRRAAAASFIRPSIATLRFPVRACRGGLTRASAARSETGRSRKRLTRYLSKTLFPS